MSTLDQRLNCCNHTPLYLKPGPPQKKKKKKKNKSQRNASREAGPVAASDCNVYIAHNRVPRASAAAARVLIAIKLAEEPLRRSGAAKTETTPNLSEMGPGSQVTHQIQSLETGSRADSAQEEKKGDEEEETMEGGHEEQKDEDLEENHQNNYSNKYPEGDGLELGLVFRQGPEKPAADEELQQSPRGDEGNWEEICLESLTSKDESLLVSSGAALEPDTSAAPKDGHLVTGTPDEDQPPKGTEVVHPGTMDHDGTDGKDDQPNTSCEMSEERMEPASLMSSSVEHEAAETSSRKRRKNSEDEMPTGGTLLTEDTKKPSNTDATAAPEDSWTATPEGDQQTAAQKPKRGRPKKSVSAATRSSLKAEDDPREEKEGTAPDEVQTRSSTAKKTLLLEERATEDAAVEVNWEEESKLPDFTHPEVRTAAGEDEEEAQKTHGGGTDEALKMKEETEEDQNLNVTPRPRGRPRRSLKAPVRRSVRGGPSAPAAGAGEAGQEAVSAALQPQPDRTDARTPGGAETSRTEGGREPDGPEAKRPRPEPLSLDSRVQLPPFDPSQSIGQEFMELKWVHFCRLCSVFCGSTDADMERHCCSQLHYCNLQKHHQQLQQDTQQSDGGEEPAGGKD